MKFVKIGDKYYNTALIGYTYSKADSSGVTHWYAQFMGGREQEITEEEFNNIIA